MAALPLGASWPRSWSTALRSRTLSYVAIVLGCVAFGLFAGKDLNWDQINYHYYAGFSALNDRSALDYFASGPQAYLPPYAFVPFYWLVSSGLPDTVVVAVLSILGSVVLLACWEIAGTLGAGANRDHREDFDHGAAWLGLALAALSPVVFVQIGSSFIDILTGGLVVTAYAVLVKGFSDLGTKEALLSAALLGLATALKPTNALFAVAAVSFFLLAPSVWRASVRLIALFCLTGVLTGVVAYAPWGYRLYADFGNPFFPLLNGLFRSPEYPSVNLTHYRFIPLGFFDGLTYPLRMLSPAQYVQTEPPAPDARFLFLFLFVAIAAGKLLFMRLTMAVGRPDGMPRTTIAGLLMSFVVCWVGWIYTSGNGRYFLPMAAVCGPLLVGCIWWISEGRRFRVYALGAVLLTQVGIVAMGAVPRWTPAPYSTRWFDVSVPESLSSRPFAFISTDLQTFAFLVPFLHPDASFASLGFQHAIGPGGSGWEKVEKLIAKQQGRVKFVFSAADTEAKDLTQGELDARSARLGYRMDKGSCEAIRLGGLSQQAFKLKSISADSIDTEFRYLAYTDIFVCDALPDPVLLARYEQGSDRVRGVFEALERKCPLLFGPVGPMTLGLDPVWSRLYPGSDVLVTIQGDRVRYLSVGMNEAQTLGTVSEVKANKVVIDCRRRRDPMLDVQGF